MGYRYVVREYSKYKDRTPENVKEYYFATKEEAEDFVAKNQKPIPPYQDGICYEIIELEVHLNYGE